jgi:ABC-2 type transport system ATP-binding protein
MIRVDHLTKRYHDTLAVDDVSFGVEPGRVTGFLGPNGAGKSTTMRMILGLDAPTAGSITVNGRAYRDLTAPLRSVGALLDAKSIDGARTARNHLLWLADSNRITRDRVDTVLATVGLAEVAHRRVAAFSLGMSQRLGIAAALLGDPETLVFDEPINGLDADGIVWIRHLMQRLAAEGRTVFVSSHLMSEMAQTADHLVVIGRGRILADGPLDEILRVHAHASVRVRATNQPVLADALRTHGAAVDTTDDGALAVTGLDAAGVGRLADAHRIPLVELTPQTASLEDAFLEMTHNDREYRALVGAAEGA